MKSGAKGAGKSERGMRERLGFLPRWHLHPVARLLGVDERPAILKSSHFSFRQRIGQVSRF
jgi:hypothetical protein